MREVTSCVLMTKKQLEAYIELLDYRINYLKQKRFKSRHEVDIADEREDMRQMRLYIAMRNHAFEALEKFRD